MEHVCFQKRGGLFDDVAIVYRTTFEKAPGQGPGSNTWSDHIQAQVAGEYTVSVKVIGADGSSGLVSGSTSTLTVGPAATDPAQCTLDLESPVLLVAGAPLNLPLYAREKFWVGTLKTSHRAFSVYCICYT